MGAAAAGGGVAAAAVLVLRMRDEVRQQPGRPATRRVDSKVPAISQRLLWPYDPRHCEGM